MFSVNEIREDNTTPVPPWLVFNPAEKVNVNGCEAQDVPFVQSYVMLFTRDWSKCPEIFLSLEEKEQLAQFESKNKIET